MTDIVNSTARAWELGDGAWRDLLARHNLAVRDQLDRFRGREVATTGDGFIAVFDGAERAIRAAQEICRAASDLGLEVRAGVHTGELELEGDNVRGVAVHIAARVSALAGAGEVFASWATRELLAGSDIGFIDRGLQELKGLSSRAASTWSSHEPMRRWSLTFGRADEAAEALARAFAPYDPLRKRRLLPGPRLRGDRPRARPRVRAGDHCHAPAARRGGLPTTRAWFAAVSGYITIDIFGDSSASRPWAASLPNIGGG